MWRRPCWAGPPRGATDRRPLRRRTPGIAVIRPGGPGAHPHAPAHPVPGHDLGADTDTDTVRGGTEHPCPQRHAPAELPGTASHPARSATPPRTAPPAPTYLSMGVRTSGGRIDLARGGAPQEFTVTLDNGDTRAYPQLKLVFQMEMLIDGRSADQAPQDGFLLQRWDPASGVWRNEPLRIANDTVPPHLHGGGTRWPATRYGPCATA